MKTRNLVLSGIFIGLLLIVQSGFYPMSQLVVGSLVNLILLSSLFYIGLKESIIISVISPILATAIGINKLPIMIIAIMGANSALVISYYMFRRKKYFGLVLAPIIKFTVIFLLSRLTFSLFMPNVNEKIAAAFSFIQLFTAYIGTILAYLIFKTIGKNLGGNFNEIS
jgi:hypothetical protein